MRQVRGRQYPPTSEQGVKAEVAVTKRAGLLHPVGRCGIEGGAVSPANFGRVSW